MLMCGSAGVVFSALTNRFAVPAALAASWRLAWVQVLQVGPFVAAWRTHVTEQTEGREAALREYAKALPAMAVAGVCLGLHFSAWVESLQRTSLAHSLLFVSMGPILLHGASWLTYWLTHWLPGFSTSDSPSMGESMGVLLGLAGTLLLLLDVQGATPTPDEYTSTLTGTIQATWQGDLIALTGAATVSIYLVIGRQLRQWMPLWIYAFGVKGFAYVTCLVWAFCASQTALRWRDVFGFCLLPYVGYALYLGVGPGIGGHTLLNALLKYCTPLTVSTAMLSEPLFGGCLGYLLGMQDMPGPLTWIGGAMLLVGLFWILAGESSRSSGHASERPSTADTAQEKQGLLNGIDQEDSAPA
jgi:drug/metabolite transporter (DMT)-like permease